MFINVWMLPEYFGKSQDFDIDSCIKDNNNNKLACMNVQKQSGLQIVTVEAACGEHQLLLPPPPHTHTHTHHHYYYHHLQEPG